MKIKSTAHKKRQAMDPYSVLSLCQSFVEHCLLFMWVMRILTRWFTYILSAQWTGIVLSRNRARAFSLSPSFSLWYKWCEKHATICVISLARKTHTHSLTLLLWKEKRYEIKYFIYFSYYAVHAIQAANA